MIRKHFIFEGVLKVMKKHFVSLTLVLTLVSFFSLDKITANDDKSTKVTTIASATTNVTDPKEVKKNEEFAIEITRLFHSVEMTYKDSEGNGNFGSIEDLFRAAYIDGSVANATGCRQMTETQYNNVCKGNGEAMNGYKFQLVYKKAKKGKPSTFAAVAFPVSQTENHITGKLSFYVDESGVIRYSDDPNVIAHAKSKYVGE